MTHAPSVDRPGTPWEAPQEVSLPEPRATGPVSVEETIRKRRSVRELRGDPLDLPQVSQLLWAAQGVTDRRGFRTAPSAGALHPLEIYLVAGAVEGLAPGTYRYVPGRHVLHPVRSGDHRDDLTGAALGQPWIGDAPAVVVVAAVFHRTTVKYGERGRRYVHMEVGHVAQNVYLQARALGLGTTMVGAFHDDEVARVVGMESGESPLGILPVGHPR